MADQLRDKLLTVGFRYFETPITLAGGQPANNKLELDYETLRHHLPVLREVVEGMCDLIEDASYQPDFVVGVPSGASRLADMVAYELGARKDRDIFSVYLEKRPGNTMGYATDIDQNTVQQLKTGVLIEDVPNRRTNTARALRLADMAPKIVAVIGIFDRLMPGDDNVQHLNVPVASLVTEPIPAILTPDSELYKQYAERAGL